MNSLSAVYLLSAPLRSLQLQSTKGGGGPAGQCFSTGVDKFTTRKAGVQRNTREHGQFELALISEIKANSNFSY